MGAGVGKGDSATDIGTVVTTTEVGEILTGADNCDVMCTEETGLGTIVEITAGTEVCCVIEEISCPPLTSMVVGCAIPLVVGNSM